MKRGLRYGGPPPRIRPVRLFDNMAGMQCHPLLLHVGMHKTGTTAIQESLGANRAWLRAEGVEYPDSSEELGGGRASHHRVARALSKRGIPSRLALFRFRRRIERSAESARLTVLSAEPFYRHWMGRYWTRGYPSDAIAMMAGHRIYLRSVAKYFRNFSPKILLYLRRPDSFMVSMYKEAMTWRGKPPDFERFLEVQAWMVAYPERIAAFREAFGELEVRSYEDECKHGLLAGFYEGLGLKAPDQETSRTRASVSNRATLWLLRAQREEPRPRREHLRRVVFARSSEGARLFRERTPSTLWPSRSVFESFVVRHRRAYEERNYELPSYEDLSPTEWGDGMHAEAQAAFGDWENGNAEMLAERERRGLLFFQEL